MCGVVRTLVPTWHGNVPISKLLGGVSPESDTAPAAAVYDGKLYLIYKGQSTRTLFVAWFDGTRWYGNNPIYVDSQDSTATTLVSNYTPACAAYTAEGSTPLLYIAFSGPSGVLYSAFFDGTKWHYEPIVTSNGAPASNSGPWMAQTGSGLIMLYKGNSESAIYSSTLTGTIWNGNQKLCRTSPISPETNHTGSIVPYQAGLYTVYKGAHSNTIYSAQLLAFGSQPS